MKYEDTLNVAELEAIVERALREDLGTGDRTGEALISLDAKCRAEIVSRGDYTIAGGPVAKLVFAKVDPSIRVTANVLDGCAVSRNDVVMTVEGAARPVLAAERTMLNFMQRMSGIATLTASFVRKVAPYAVEVLDTRKTTPGLRALEKYAVRCGGGTNHRMGLYDRILIKDNHRRIWGRDGDRSLADAVRAAREKTPGVLIEIEVENERELEDALTGQPDWVLLDNMTPEVLKACVSLCDRRARLEASGGITIDNVEEIAASGVDAVSLGALTHSAPAADLSLEFLEQ
jgi:nicotinate-nucleotide pyrophosphorylase (carboxylating)